MLSGQDLQFSLKLFRYFKTKILCWIPSFVIKPLKLSLITTTQRFNVNQYRSKCLTHLQRKSALSMDWGLPILVSIVRKYSGWSLMMHVTICDIIVSWSVAQVFFCPQHIPIKRRRKVSLNSVFNLLVNLSRNLPKE